MHSPFSLCPSLSRSLYLSLCLSVARWRDLLRCCYSEISRGQVRRLEINARRYVLVSSSFRDTEESGVRTLDALRN